jgi:hypothetical protein
VRGGTIPDARRPAAASKPEVTLDSRVRFAPGGRTARFNVANVRDAE